jgi:predicted dehydrogenase
VEKPMTLFVREGRWMVEAARKYNRIVQVGTQQRSGEHYHKAIELMRSGYLGKVHSARIGLYRNVTPGFGRPADSAPPPDLNYDMWLGPAPRRPYNLNRSLYHFRWFWDYAGGQMTNWGAHDIDIVRWLMDSKGPASVYSLGGKFALEDNCETPDTQDALFEYPGLTLNWSAREASQGDNMDAGLHFYGTKGAMNLSRGGFEIRPDTRAAPTNQIPQIKGHPAGGPPLDKSDKPAPWTEPMKVKASGPLFDAHARNFLDCIKSRELPNADVEEGHRTVTACHLANISMRLRRPIRWDAEKEEILGDSEASKWLVRPYRKPWDEVLRSIRS